MVFQEKITNSILHKAIMPKWLICAKNSPRVFKLVENDHKALSEHPNKSVDKIYESEHLMRRNIEISPRIEKKARSPSPPTKNLNSQAKEKAILKLQEIEKKKIKERVKKLQKQKIVTQKQKDYEESKVKREQERREMLEDIKKRRKKAPVIIETQVNVENTQIEKQVMHTMHCEANSKEHQGSLLYLNKSEFNCVHQKSKISLKIEPKIPETPLDTACGDTLKTIKDYGKSTLANFSEDCVKVGKIDDRLSLIMHEVKAQYQQYMKEQTSSKPEPLKDSLDNAI